MKISLFELLFNKGKDQDWPANSNFVLIFDPQDSYSVEGKTHDGISHAIKHAHEFFPGEVEGLLRNFGSLLAGNISKISVKNSSNKIIDDKNLTSSVVQDSETLKNTLDRINDKMKTGKRLTQLELQGYEIAKKIFQLYDTLADHLNKSAVNVDNIKSSEEIKQKLKNGNPISFQAEYQGHMHKYIYDPSTKALAAFRDDGSLNTIFKMNRNPIGYIASHGNIKNTAILNAFK